VHACAEPRLAGGRRAGRLRLPPRQGDLQDYKEQTFHDTNYPLFMERWGAAYSEAIGAYHAADALAPLRDEFVRMTDSSPPPLLAAFVDRVRNGGGTYAMTEASHYLRDQGGFARLLPLVRERGLLRRPSTRHPLPRGSSPGGDRA